MTLFNIDVTKVHSITRENWGNRYYVNAADLTDAASAAPIIVTGEKAFHFDNIEFLQARVSTVAPFDSSYVTVPLTGNGSKILTGKQMPLFLCMEVKFPVFGFGKPLMKYYHTGFDDVFYDADFTYDDTLLSDALTALQDMLSDLQTNGTPMVKDGDHEALLNPIVRTLVLSHQFTKASKRNPL